MQRQVSAVGCVACTASAYNAYLSYEYPEDVEGSIDVSWFTLVARNPIDGSLHEVISDETAYPCVAQKVGELDAASRRLLPLALN